MGAVVTVYVNNLTSADYQALIQQLANRLQTELGEPVEVDMAITDIHAMPNAIEINHAANDGRMKIGK